MTAPEGSFTKPEMVPRSDCPNSSAGNIKITHKTNLLRILGTPEIRDRLSICLSVERRNATAAFFPPTISVKVRMRDRNAEALFAGRVLRHLAGANRGRRK